MRQKYTASGFNDSQEAMDTDRQHSRRARARSQTGIQHWTLGRATAAREPHHLDRRSQGGHVSQGIAIPLEMPFTVIPL